MIPPTATLSTLPLAATQEADVEGDICMAGGKFVGGGNRRHDHGTRAGRHLRAVARRPGCRGFRADALRRDAPEQVEPERKRCAELRWEDRYHGCRLARCDHLLDGNKRLAREPEVHAVAEQHLRDDNRRRAVVAGENGARINVGDVVVRLLLPCGDRSVRDRFRLGALPDGRAGRGAGDDERDGCNGTQ